MSDQLAILVQALIQSLEQAGQARLVLIRRCGPGSFGRVQRRLSWRRLATGEVEGQIQGRQHGNPIASSDFPRIPDLSHGGIHPFDCFQELGLSAIGAG